MRAHLDSFLIDEPDGLYSWFDAWIERGSVMDASHGEVIRKSAQKYTDERRFLQNSNQLGDINLILKAPNLTYRFNDIASLGLSTHIIFPVRDVRSEEFEL